MHPCSLISIFVIRCLDSIISPFSVSEISSLRLVSVAAQAGLSYLVANPEDRFSCGDAHMSHIMRKPVLWGLWLGKIRSSLLSFTSCSEAWFELSHDKTNKMTVRPAKTQISLGICPVLSESLLCAQWVAKDLNFLHADSEGSDQSGWMPRLIWVFAGCTCHYVGFVMRQFILCLQQLSQLYYLSSEQ